MEKIKLYRYVREDGGVSVSPTDPGVEYTEMVRIIAGVGKAVTKDGIELYPAKDECSDEGWYEVDAPEFTETEDGENEISSDR